MTTFVLYARFVLAGAVAGALSGALYSALAVRGAIFGAALAAGTIPLSPWGRSVSAGPVPRRHALAAALAVSVVTAVLIPLVAVGFYAIDRLPVLSPLLSSLTLSSLMLLGYRRRHLGESPALHWYLLAPLLSSAVRMIGFAEAFVPSEFFLFPLAGAYPFILLWLAAARLTDPAW